MPSITASVSGSDRMKREPAPGVDCTTTRPPTSWMFLRTTSMPTPRPETSDTSAAVEKPGAKISMSICSSVRVWPRSTSALSMALASTRSRSMPRPSSSISMKMRPDRCSAARWMVPSAGLPTAMRSSGVSMPWSRALRIRWVRGSDNCSITVLSTSVFSPLITSRACLPSLVDRSRTRRGALENSALTGWARMAMTLSCNSRV